MLLTQLIIYLCLCVLYRQRQSQWLFTLKTLQTLKINKYRREISDRIEKHEKRIKWILFWPLVDMYEWYEGWQRNRNRNS
jgi:chlorite dismutase